MHSFLSLICITCNTAIHIKADPPYVEVLGEVEMEAMLSLDYGQPLLAEQAIKWTGTKLW